MLYSSLLSNDYQDPEFPVADCMSWRRSLPSHLGPERQVVTRTHAFAGESVAELARARRGEDARELGSGGRAGNVKEIVWGWSALYSTVS